MPTCLSQLPNDVVHQTALYLGIRDYAHLRIASKDFANHLEDHGTARKVIKSNLSHSLAGKQALAAGFHSRKQLSRIYWRREALRTARPYSVCHIANATSFVYADSILCYSTTHDIRLLDLSNPSTTERVISNRFLASKLPGAGERANSLLPYSTSILAFDNNLLAVLACFNSGDYLFVLNVTSGDVPQRCLLIERLRSTNKLFALLGPEHLFYGTQSASSSSGYPEWLVQGFSLARTSGTTTSCSCQPTTPFPLQLSRISGLDPSSTVAFTIHAGYFIALTNQTGHEAEEVNWTSYYRYIAFGISDPNPDLSIKTIFRRQDHEGPINDTWTELKFSVDETTGGLVLVEGRKEFLEGADGWTRTWYGVPWEAAAHGVWADNVSINPDDRLSTLVHADEHGKADDGDEIFTRYEDRDSYRPQRYAHCERAPTTNTLDGDSDGDALSKGKGNDQCVSATKDYIRAKTKFGAYDLNRGCSVELVVDDVPGDGWRTKERLRLRVVSRLEKSPLAAADSHNANLESHVMLRPKVRDRKTGLDILDSERSYHDSEIHLWPRDEEEVKEGEDPKPPLPDEIADLMCPGGKAGQVKGMLGEEGLVYAIGSPGTGGERQLVLVCFDPAWGFEGMRGLDGEVVKPRVRMEAEAAAAAAAAAPAVDDTSGGSGKRKRDEHERGVESAVTGRSTKRHESQSRDAVVEDATAAAGAGAESTSEPVAVADDQHDSGVVLWDIDANGDHGHDNDDERALCPNNEAEDVDEREGEAAPSTATAATLQPAAVNPLLWREEAMYLRLNRGWWVRW